MIKNNLLVPPSQFITYSEFVNGKFVKSHA